MFLEGWRNKVLIKMRILRSQKQTTAFTILDKKGGKIATWSVEAGDCVEHGIEPIYFRLRAVGLEAVHDHRLHKHDIQTNKQTLSETTYISRKLKYC